MPDATAILARMKAPCEAAPKEPWTVIVEECDENGCERGEIFINEIERSFHSCEWADPKDWDRDMAVAEFCAAARTGWPATIRALEVAREKLRYVEQEMGLMKGSGAEIDSILEGRDA